MKSSPVNPIGNIRCIMKILNIQRMSTEDGPGLRTTVFFKGCPLKCRWCHNPESLFSGFQKEWVSVRCIRCGICISVCPENALTLKEEGPEINRDQCRLCMKCTEECPTGAMSPIGKEIPPDALYEEITKDQAYFNGAGGITLSGGEVLLQADEALILCQKLKGAGISVALDTSGFASFRHLESLLPFVDLILYDIKLIDLLAHRNWCGVDNTLILDNLIRLSEAGVRLWIRTPIIPGATDSVDNIRGIGSFLQDHSIRYERWELCAFNNLCKDKYHRLGIRWEFESTPLETRETMENLLEVARKSAAETDRIAFTGITRLKEETSCLKK